MPQAKKSLRIKTAACWHKRIHGETETPEPVRPADSGVFSERSIQKKCPALLFCKKRFGMTPLYNGMKKIASQNR